MVEDDRARIHRLTGAIPAIQQCLESTCPLAALIRENIQKQKETYQAYLDDPLSVDINTLQFARGALMQLKSLHDIPFMIKAEIEGRITESEKKMDQLKKSMQKKREVNV